MKDDLGLGNNPKSKINGNSGDRVACGIVAIVNKPALWKRFNKNFRIF